jgi:hypothetical protein
MVPALRHLRLLLGTLLALGLALAGASSASALTYGLNWDGNNSSQEEMLDAVQASGATVYHLPLQYNAGSGNWEGNDELVEAAWERGITILPTLAHGRRFPLPGAPGWATWGQWVRELVERYGVNGSFWDGKANPTPILAWEVWNEPNIAVNDPQLSQVECEVIGQPWNAEVGNCAQPAAYGAFLRYSAEAIQAGSRVKTGHGTNVLFGSLNTQVGESAGSFIAGAAAAGGLDPEVTGVAIHPYSFADGVAGMAADVESVRAELDALGAGEKSLWITEMGWPTEGTVPAGETVDGEEQATLLTGALEWIKAMAATDDIRLAAWYNARDFGGAAWDGHSGLQAEDGSYQPAWYAFQEQTGAEVSGSCWAAFQADTGTLWLYSTAGGYEDTGVPMLTGSSPTIATQPGGGALVSFQAPGGEPATYSTAAGTLVAGSPAQAEPPDAGVLALALKAYLSAHWPTSTAAGAFGTTARLAPGTSPSVATVP